MGIIPLDNECDQSVYCPQPISHRSKIKFCTKQSRWSFTTRYLIAQKSAASLGPHRTCWTHTRPRSPLAYEMIN